MNYQKKFMYKVASNMNNANRVPVYSLVPDFKIDREKVRLIRFPKNNSLRLFNRFNTPIHITHTLLSLDTSFAN